MRRRVGSGIAWPSTASRGRCGWPRGRCAACRRSGAATGAAAGSHRDGRTRPSRSALAKKRMRLTGSRLKTSASATFRRPLSMRKSLVAADLAARAPAQRIEQAAEPGERLDLLHLQRRAQDGRQVADVLGDQEVVLHEALDGAQAAALDVAERARPWPAARRRSAAPRRGRSGNAGGSARPTGSLRSGGRSPIPRRVNMPVATRSPRRRRWPYRYLASQCSVCRSRRPPLPSLMLGSTL